MWPSEVLIEEDFTVSLSQELQRSNLLEKKNICYNFFFEQKQNKLCNVAKPEIVEIYISSLLELATVRAKDVDIYFLGITYPTEPLRMKARVDIMTKNLRL